MYAELICDHISLCVDIVLSHPTNTLVSTKKKKKVSLHRYHCINTYKMLKSEYYVQSYNFVYKDYGIV